MTSHIRVAVFLLALATLGACNTIATLAAPRPVQSAAALKPGQYTLDTSHAALTFRINHLGFSSFVGRFERFDASLDFDTAAPTAARLSASVDMTSLDIANPDFAATLMGPAWFDTQSFPKAEFRSTAIKVVGETGTDPDSEATGRVTGDLTWRGITRPIILDVTFNGGGQDALRGAYVTGFSATGTLNRSEFGVTRFVGPVGDEVQLQIEVEFLKG